MRSGWALAALLLLGPVVAVAQEGMDERYFEGAKAALRAGQLEAFLKIAQDERVGQALVAQPKILAGLCEVLHDEADDLGAKHADDAVDVADLLLDLAGKAQEQHPSVAESHWSRAWSLLGRDGILVASGKTADIGAWTSAVDAVEKAYEIDPDDGKPIGYAVGLLLSASELAGADPAALIGRAEALVARGLAAHPEAEGLRGASVRMKFQRAKSLFPAQKSDVVSLLQEALAELAPLLEAESEPYLLGAVHTDIVTFVKMNNLRVDAEYRMRAGSWSNLRFELPRSNLWRMGADGDRLHQISATKGPLRTVQFIAYAWDRAYGNDRVGGDNMKGLAKQDSLWGQTDFKDVKPAKPKKARMNGKLKGGYYYELTGTDKDGDPLRVRSWYFKSEEGHQTTYNVHVFEWNPAELDPAFEAFLASIHEVE